jgi:hypothetical protein
MSVMVVQVRQPGCCHGPGVYESVFKPFERDLFKKRDFRVIP